jgi:uncharacterized membrane protein HdeD (DUF308 family)
MQRHQVDPHATWPFFLGRALVALLLSVALFAKLGVARTELTGGLGLFAITDGVLCSLIWLTHRDARPIGWEGAVGIALGMGVLHIEPSALALLAFVSTRSLLVAALELSYARPRRRTALHPWLQAAAVVSGLEGVGFGAVAMFDYDALDLTPCIAGCTGVVGALHLMLALKLRVPARSRRTDASYRTHSSVGSRSLPGRAAQPWTARK